MKRRTILITGASGKLGSAAARILGRDHAIVRMDVRKPRDGEPDTPSGRTVVGSVTDRTAVAEAFEGVDSVIHCAAIPWSRPPFDELLHINVAGTVNLLEEAAARPGVEQFIFISTIRVHGVLEEPGDDFMPRFLPFDETHPYLTVEYYGGSKVQAEHWCRMYVRRCGKPAVVLRPSYILPLHAEPDFAAQPPPDQPTLAQYVATSDLVNAMSLALDYHPRDGFDRFLMHAPEQPTTTPTLQLVDRYFPAVPADREKLSACDGFGALVDCSHAAAALNWAPQSRCRR